MGYIGYSMSERAALAYSDGEKPFSKWTKKDIINVIKEEAADPSSYYKIDNNVIMALEKTPVKTLKNAVLSCTSWHHTSSYYNHTNFYTVDLEKVEALTVERVEALNTQNTEPMQEPEPELWECVYLEWSGTRKHPKAEEVRAVGEIRGNWFYLPGGNKKSINARGFKKIKQI